MNDNVELLVSIIDNSPFGILILKQSGEIITINQLAVDFLDLKNTPEKLIGKNIPEMIVNIPQFYDELSSISSNEKASVNIESVYNNYRYLLIRGRQIDTGYFFTIENITKLKELEANSILAILEGQEKERRRIGREIHDGIGPQLSSVKLYLDSLADSSNHSTPNELKEKITSLGSIINSITDDLRGISHFLIPRVLDEFGILAACENLINQYNSAGKIHFNLYSNLGKNDSFDKEIELNLFRSSQELLNNVVKHSNAKEVLFQLIKHENSIVLMVEDDGDGFERENLQPDNYGIGLTNIDTRIRLLDGVFILESTPGKGTIASVEIPLGFLQ